MSKLLNGIQADTRPGARQALAHKLGQHAFSATVRLGVEAATATRRKTLLLGLAAAIGTTESPDVRITLRQEKAERVNTPRASWSVFTPAQRLTVTEVARLSGWPIADHDEQYPGQPPLHRVRYNRALNCALGTGLWLMPVHLALVARRSATTPPTPCAIPGSSAQTG